MRASASETYCNTAENPEIPVPRSYMTQWDNNGGRPYLMSFPFIPYALAHVVRLVYSSHLSAHCFLPGEINQFSVTDPCNSVASKIFDTGKVNEMVCVPLRWAM